MPPIAGNGPKAPPSAVAPSPIASPSGAQPGRGTGSTVSARAPAELVADGFATAFDAPPRPRPAHPPTKTAIAAIPAASPNASRRTVPVVS